MRLASGPNRRRLVRLARWLLTLGLLVLLLATVDLRATWRVLGSAELLPFAAALGVALCDRALMIGKWYPLAKLQLPDLALGRAVRVYLAASFAAVFLPSTVGGDVLRSWMLGRDGRERVSVGASVLMERLLGLVGLCVLVVLALVIALDLRIAPGPLLPLAVGLGAVALLALLGGPFLLRLPALRRRIDSPGGGTGRRLVRQFAVAYRSFGGHPRLLAVLAFLSFVEQLFAVAVTGLVAGALGVPLTLSMLLVAVPVATFFVRLPISVGGLGVKEASLVYLLGLFGIPGAEALSIALGLRLVELFSYLPGAAAWADTRRVLAGDVPEALPERLAEEAEEKAGARAPAPSRAMAEP